MNIIGPINVNESTVNISHYSSQRYLYRQGYFPKDLDGQQFAEVVATKSFIDRKFGPTRLEVVKSNTKNLIAYFTGNDGTLYEIDITKFNELSRQVGVNGSLEQCIKAFESPNSTSTFITSTIMSVKRKFSERVRAELRTIEDKRDIYDGMIALLDEARAYNREELEPESLN